VHDNLQNAVSIHRRERGERREKHRGGVDRITGWNRIKKARILALFFILFHPVILSKLFSILLRFVSLRVLCVLCGESSSQ
jgi:hypothetical protein